MFSQGEYEKSEKCVPASWQRMFAEYENILYSCDSGDSADAPDINSSA